MMAGISAVKKPKSDGFATRVKAAIEGKFLIGIFCNPAHGFYVYT
jgi:hypothetical protein